MRRKVSGEKEKKEEKKRVKERNWYQGIHMRYTQLRL